MVVVLWAVTAVVLTPRPEAGPGAFTENCEPVATVTSRAVDHLGWVVGHHDGAGHRVGDRFGGRFVLRAPAPVVDVGLRDVTDRRSVPDAGDMEPESGQR